MIFVGEQVYVHVRDRLRLCRYDGWRLLTIVHDDERVWVLSSLDSWEVGRRDGVGVLADTSRSVARADHLRVRPRAAARAARLSLCRRPGAAAATEP